MKKGEEKKLGRFNSISILDYYCHFPVA
jgi:hypothetical protein